MSSNTTKNFESLYNKYLNFYVNTNFLNFNNSYLNKFFKPLPYLSIILYAIGTMLIIFYDNGYISSIKSVLYGFVVLIFFFLIYKLYFYLLKKSFLKYHDLGDVERTDYIFYDVFSVLKEDKDFTKNQKSFYEMCDIEIHQKRFIEDPIFLILISIIITILGILLSQIKDTTILIQWEIYLLALVFILSFIFQKKQHFGRSKHASFKLFLLKIYHYYQNPPK
jgi:hypothetical protein